MANDSNATWINFTADDLPQAQADLFAAMIAAKTAFEASFPANPGKTLRFSYKGADWSRMGMCEVDAPKTKAQVTTSLAAWLTAQKANGARV